MESIKEEVCYVKHEKIKVHEIKIVSERIERDKDKNLQN